MFRMWNTTMMYIFSYIPVAMKDCVNRRLYSGLKQPFSESNGIFMVQFSITIIEILFFSFFSIAS